MLLLRGRLLLPLCPLPLPLLRAAAGAAGSESLGAASVFPAAVVLPPLLAAAVLRTTRAPSVLCLSLAATVRGPEPLSAADCRLNVATSLRGLRQRCWRQSGGRGAVGRAFAGRCVRVGASVNVSACCGTSASLAACFSSSVHWAAYSASRCAFRFVCAVCSTARAAVRAASLAALRACCACRCDSCCCNLRASSLGPWRSDAYSGADCFRPVCAAAGAAFAADAAACAVGAVACARARLPALRVFAPTLQCAARLPLPSVTAASVAGAAGA